MSRELDFSDPCYLMNIWDCMEQRMAALEAKVAAPSASANSGITQGAKAQTAVLLMDKLFERWQQSAEWGGLAAEVMREWEACCYCDKTAAS